jgi:hypothetical protein
MAETEDEMTETTQHALDQDPDEELLPVSNTRERDLNAASTAKGVSVLRDEHSQQQGIAAGLPCEHDESNKDW